MRTQKGAAPVLAGEPGRRFAAERLRQAILSGDVAPGQRLVEEELAGLLAVGIEMRRYIGLDILARSRHDAASTNQSEEVTLTAIHRIKSRTKITRRPAPQTPPPRT